MTILQGFWLAVTFVLGVTIGSFLNAVIYRLPRNLSLLDPKTSICPNCKHALGVLDLAPLLSFLLLKQRCRYCKQPISWRYFNNELLTGLLFAAIYLRFSQPQEIANCIAMLAFTAVLVPVYFIDLDTFTIPDSLNLLLFFIPLTRDIWGIMQHEAGHQLLWGWLPISLLGALIGVLIFGTVRVAGWMWKRQEAMGLGDVLLARGMGAMLVSVIPPGTGALHLLRPFPIWVFLSCIGGIVAFPILKSARERKARLAPQQAPVGSAEPEGLEEMSTLGRELKDIAYCLYLGDLYDYIMVRIGRFPLPPPAMEDDFVPAPTAIPFGPFLVIGFLCTALFGEALTAAYLAYAFKRS
jgi:leader peptidase (prepilin peptidase)/N-methyltransferase